MTWAAAAHWIHNQYHLAVVYEGNPFFFSDIKSILLIALIFFPLLTLIKNEKLNEFMGVLNLVLIPVLLVPVIWNIIVIWG